MPKCRECGVTVQKDDEASAWLNRAVYFDPDVLDYNNNGEHCESGGLHEVGP